VTRIEQLVLDSWAILAWLQGEPQGALIRDLFRWAEGDKAVERRLREHFGRELGKPKLFVSVINLGEVFYILGRRKGEREARETVDEIRASLTEVLAVPEEIVFRAASFKIRYPIAYADGFALATAQAVGGALVTGDHELKGIRDVPIFWLGE
jgi:predicted nucleic acid-binding protein